MSVLTTTRTTMTTIPTMDADDHAQDEHIDASLCSDPSPCRGAGPCQARGVLSEHTPPEILLFIISCLLPNDAWSLARTCRYLSCFMHTSPAIRVVYNNIASASHPCLPRMMPADADGLWFRRRGMQSPQHGGNSVTISPPTPDRLIHSIRASKYVTDATFHFHTANNFQHVPTTRALFDLFVQHASNVSLYKFVAYIRADRIYVGLNNAVAFARANLRAGEALRALIRPLPPSVLAVRQNKCWKLAATHCKDAFYDAVATLVRLDGRFMAVIIDAFAYSSSTSPMPCSLDNDVPVLAGLVESKRTLLALAVVAGAEVITAEATMVLIRHCASDLDAENALGRIIPRVYNCVGDTTPIGQDIVRMGVLKAETLVPLQQVCGMTPEAAVKVTFESIWNHPCTVTNSVCSLHAAVVNSAVATANHSGVPLLPAAEIVADAGRSVAAFLDVISLRHITGDDAKDFLNMVVELVQLPPAVTQVTGVVLPAVTRVLLRFKTMPLVKEVVNAATSLPDTDHDNAATDRMQFRRRFRRIATRLSHQVMVKVVGSMLKEACPSNPRTEDMFRRVNVLYCQHFVSVLKECGDWKLPTSPRLTAMIATVLKDVQQNYNRVVDLSGGLLE
jgi:hypothetical protein